MFSLYSSAFKMTSSSASPSTMSSTSHNHQRQQTRSMYLATSPSPTPPSTPAPAPAPVAAPAPLPKPVIFATSGLGGVLGWCVVHPFNTIAVRSNLASASGQKFSLGEMLKKQGFMSLYDGLSAGVARQVFYATARFGLFETFRDILHEYRGKTDFAAR